MKKIINVIILFLGIIQANGQQVTLNEAYEFADSWLLKKNSQYAVEKITPFQSRNLPILYNCSLKPSGYILISGEKSCRPIIGYSLINKFDTTNLPVAIKFSIDKYQKKINDLQTENRTIHPEWNITKSTLKSAKGSVEPLIQTKWNQSYPYNANCPNNTPAGCVAIALAQLMKFYNYPSHGLNENSYASYNYGLQSADFKNTSYDWGEMTNTTSDLNEEIAKLIYHCGVAVSMNYEPGGSEASTGVVVNAMVDNFGYSKQSEEVLISQDSTQLFEVLVNELENKRPVIYSGSTKVNNGESHMFIIDGYDENGLFHINWGWGGSGDGYYNIQDIVWQYRQRAYLNLYPPPLRAAFEADTTYGTAPLKINFTDYSLSYNNTITKWEWDFNNDGIVDSEDKNPSFTYNKFDINSVKLIVSNDTYSDTLIENDLITIACPAIPKYVSTDGDDLNGDGTKGNPFKTIQRAINLSFLNNDTIIVDNGKYIENVDFKGKNVLLTSYFYFTKNHLDIINTIIDGNRTGSVVNFDNKETKNAQIIGFTIQNGSGDYVHPHWAAGDSKRPLGGGIRCDNNSSPLLKYLIIKDNVADHFYGGDGSAIYAAKGSNLHLNNSIVLKNSRCRSALFLHGSSIKIDSTFIIDNEGAGIYSASGNISDIQRTLIAYNKKCYVSSNFSYGGNAIRYDYGSNGLLTNSIIFNNESGGIYLHVAKLKAANSIIYSHNKPYEISFSNSQQCGPSMVTITNSNLKGGQNSILTNDNGTINWLEEIKDYKPLFSDTANFNFRTQENCESIDAGTNFFIYEQDTILHIPQSSYFGNYPDIGIFELFSEETTVEKLLKYFQNNLTEITPIYNYERKSDISIYPNPVRGFLKINNIQDHQIKNLSVVNMQGEQILFIKNLANHNIDVSDLNRGIYFLRLFCNDKTIVLKFVKQ